MGDVLVILLVFATLGVMLAGVVLMAVGGKVNQKYSNKLMVARVSLQGMVLLVLVLVFMLGSR